MSYSKDQLLSDIDILFTKRAQSVASSISAELSDSALSGGELLQLYEERLPRRAIEKLLDLARNETGALPLKGKREKQFIEAAKIPVEQFFAAASLAPLPSIIKMLETIKLLSKDADITQELATVVGGDPQKNLVMTLIVLTVSKMAGLDKPLPGYDRIIEALRERRKQFEDAGKTHEI